MTTIENLAGVPSATELSILANEIFPDLTEGVYGVPEADASQAITYVASSSAGSISINRPPAMIRHDLSCLISVIGNIISSP